MLGLGSTPGLERHIREYRNGRDLNASSRDVLVIDLFGLSADQVRERYPAVYQRLVERVKPVRDAKGDSKDGAGYAALWWQFGKPRQEMRRQLAALHRYIATVETSKHRTFQFLDASILPDNKLIAVALSDACQLGVLSSTVHVDWALAVGSWLGVGNDPVYVKSRCFETFPFPHDDTGLTPELADRIRALAEQLDAHRKARQAAHASVTLTGLYNVLDKLRRSEPLSAKDKTLHEQGLVSVLQSLHDELDAAVLEAYGWSDLGPVPWRDDAARAMWTETLLSRLVALNAQRAAEEAAGTVRWLRPDFQAPARRQGNEGTSAAPQSAQPESLPQQASIEGLPLTPIDDAAEEAGEVDANAASAATAKAAAGASVTQAWPAALPDQVRAVAQVLSASPSPLPLAAIESAFKGRGRWKRSLPRILDTLEALGRAQRTTEGWRG